MKTKTSVSISLSVLSVLSVVFYFVPYIHIKIMDMIGDIFGFLSDISEDSSFNNIGNFGKMLLNNSDLFSDLNTSDKALIICFVVLIFVVPTLLLICNAVVNIVFAITNKINSKTVYIFSIISSAYLIVTQIVVFALIGKINAEYKNEIGDLSLLTGNSIIKLQFGYYLQVIFALVMLVLSICVLALSKKCMNKPLESCDVALVGVNGQYKGCNFVVNSDESIVVGRDSTICQIVISQNAEKVSRKHCEVYYDYELKCYIVTDYSSNGTYVGDKRLRQNVPSKLKCGMIIALGNEQNTFKLN